MGRGSKSSGYRTYLKVCAAFKCTKEECGKVWNSVHVWGRENAGVYCEFCDKRAKLVDAADETLKLDTYRCNKEGCDNTWQSIHGEEKEAPSQECDLCKTMVSADGSPQERFGRHYWFKCENEECGGEKPEWEDFSLEAQKTQRCSGCHSAGTIVKITKAKPNFRFTSRGRSRTKKENGGGDAGGPTDPGAATSHNAELCDMCQDIITQKRGRSCHKWRKVVAKVETQEDGSVGEKIVTVS